MTLLDKITEKVLRQIDSSSGFKQEGAYNLRENGVALCHGDTEHIKIKKKEDKPGIDVYIDGEAKGEQVHIPVVVSTSGMVDVVYNDFYIADGAEVTIVAGCGIHNSGCNETRHDGIPAPPLQSLPAIVSTLFLFTVPSPSAVNNHKYKYLPPCVSFLHHELKIHLP